MHLFFSCVIALTVSEGSLCFAPSVLILYLLFVIPAHPSLLLRASFRSSIRLTTLIVRLLCIVSRSLCFTTTNHYDLYFTLSYNDIRYNDTDRWVRLQ